MVRNKFGYGHSSRYRSPCENEYNSENSRSCKNNRECHNFKLCIISQIYIKIFWAIGNIAGELTIPIRKSIIDEGFLGICHSILEKDIGIELIKNAGFLLGNIARTKPYVSYSLFKPVKSYGNFLDAPCPHWCDSKVHR